MLSTKENKLVISSIDIFTDTLLKENSKKKFKDIESLKKIGLQIANTYLVRSVVNTLIELGCTKNDLLEIENKILETKDIDHIKKYFESFDKIYINNINKFEVYLMFY